MTAPTEGPWIRHGITAGCHLIRAAAGRIIGCIGIQGIDPRTWFVDETDRANATLIAAAPDLRHALERLLPEQSTVHSPTCAAHPGRDDYDPAKCDGCAIDEAHRAIALADGAVRHACDPDPGLPTLLPRDPPAPSKPCGCGHQRQDHSVGGFACTIEQCGCTLFSTAPRRTVEEDLREALDDAAASLETASRWGRQDGTKGGLREMRPWAKNRAAAARRALGDDTLDEPKRRREDCPECGHEAPGHARRCLSQCPPTVKR